MQCGISSNHLASHNARLGWSRTARTESGRPRSSWRPPWVRLSRPPLRPLSTKALIQVNATRAGLGDQQQHKDLGTLGRFSRRLQLDPGLEPPTSWSLLPLYGPYNYLRAALAKSPGLEAIYLKVRGNAVDLVGNMLVREVRELTAAWLSSPAIETHVLIRYAGR